MCWPCAATSWSFLQGSRRHTNTHRPSVWFFIYCNVFDNAIPFKDRYPSLKLSQFKTMKPVGRLPKLKGSGQQCKGLTRVMSKVFQEDRDPEDQAHKRIVEGLEAMRITDQLYMRHRYANKMPQFDAGEVIRASFKFCQICTGLVRHYHKKKMPVFHYTMKHHYCLHIALTTKYLNPYMAECSSGEDYMKFAKKTTSRIHVRQQHY